MTYLTKNNDNKWQAMLAIVLSRGNYSPQQVKWEWKKLFIKRLISENCLIFLLQYAGLMLNTLTLTHFPIWFASGTACGFIFLRGYRILPAIGLGSFFAYYLSGMSLGKAALCAGIISLQPAIILSITRRYIDLTLIFHCFSSMIKFILLSFMVTAMTTFLLHGVYNLHWLNDWIANLNGILIVAFAIVSLDTYFPQYSEFFYLNKKKLAGWIILFLGLTFTFLLSKTPVTLMMSALLILFFIIKMNTLYGWCGVITTVFSYGVLVNLSIELTWTYSNLLTELIVTLIVIIGLFIATDRGVRL